MASNLYQVYTIHEMDFVVEANSKEEAKQKAIDIWYKEAKSSDDPIIDELFKIEEED